ncbi:NAD(P)H-binding protein [Aeromicrobium chenweiae]|uniref:NAD-dependent dehydratase n=1 Tax=Aeromicrobium chenweiae TaxID=2079793 RepID=A0A2S0WPA7_9ACTN|nr:NAD(P)H-binding protein [Aeromicrobium chenweiae]AWB93132.1 NAD-dependent dehydratase [Aeromicrobium chenweiae]TGN34121.1 NAD(P)-dependent oxidoreductase [Aeromicrobium chenweiae]
MKVFVIGITGGVGSLLAHRLVARGDDVRGLVRHDRQSDDLVARGIVPVLGDLSTMTVDDLATAFGDADAVVFTAGSNAGSAELTRAVDEEGSARAVEAAAGRRFITVSVLPEAWRERHLTDDEEYYFAAKKRADVVVSRSEADWVILRPSLLVDGAGRGTVTLGPAVVHGESVRDDVAATLVEILHEPRISRQVLELDSGTTPIPQAVRATVRT